MVYVLTLYLRIKNQENFMFNTHFDHGVIAEKNQAQLIINYVNSLNENNFLYFLQVISI